MATATTTDDKLELVIAPFGIEIDHPRNADVLLQSIPGARLRSAIDGTKGIVDVKTGDEMVPRDQANHMASFPKTPGMQLHVNPQALSYVILDPLHDNEEMCGKVQRWMKNESPFPTTEKLNGLKPQEGKLDVHRMKTLVREMLWLVDAKEAKRVKGPIPDMDEVESLPGYFLLNPGSRVQNTQPMFEKDFPSWLEKMGQSGG